MHTLKSLLSLSKAGHVDDLQSILKPPTHLKYMLLLYFSRNLLLLVKTYAGQGC